MYYPVPADMSSAEDEYKDLDKIGCARQFESELSLHSLALFLQSAKTRHVDRSCMGSVPQLSLLPLVAPCRLFLFAFQHFLPQI